MPGFPNFFMTYGPGTHLAHGGSLILNSELQMRYINKCLEHLITEGLRAMEPLPEPTKDWHRRSQEAIRQTVWAQPSIKHSYFKNADGEISHRQPVAVERISLCHQRTHLVRLHSAGGVSMRAVVVEPSGQVSVESRPDPVLPGPDGAIVKVEAASICGSDLHFLEGHYPIAEPVSVGQ